ncbi:septum formation inhibitor Maf [Salegentibacter salinarum]|uniref:dTTP/UTP pyrophosphatase n=1 Tax=Salegentibacter salinarum TaxID=447422 RepID=A0A2N0TN30_9FLAO|nr:Maf-like protein [Salegentibacter salinarum]PKD16151.1 septum formation inhibitor Maf [Salegentibacter salinarum]SKB68794.1 septum formation protein [Salegentibacter salinarum]
MLKALLKNKEIILASGSPRRHQFFKDLDIPFKTDVRPVKEVCPDYLKKEEITDFLAQLKAEAFQKELKKDQILITSDTIVYNKEKAMGKPETAAEAKEMLRSLSGKTHSVFTSVCFTTRHHQSTVNCETKVTFKDLTSGEIDYYVENFKPFDKAGGYAIQEWIGLIGISNLEGSYFNVVGLPTHLVYNELLDLASF